MFGKKGMFNILSQVPDYQFLDLDLKRKDFRYRSVFEEEFLYFASQTPSFEVSLDFWGDHFDFSYNNFSDMTFIRLFFDYKDNVICNIVVA